MSDFEHGTLSGYTHHHCRCAKCQLAHTEYAEQHHGGLPGFWSGKELDALFDHLGIETEDDYA